MNWSSSIFFLYLQRLTLQTPLWKLKSRLSLTAFRTHELNKATTTISPVLEGHWLSIFDCLKNSWVSSKCFFPCGSREALLSEVPWVKNPKEYCVNDSWGCSLQESGWIYSVFEGELGNVKQPISKQSHSAHANCIWRAERYKWRLWRGHMFSQLFFRTALLCVGRRNKLHFIMWRVKVF